MVRRILSLLSVTAVSLVLTGLPALAEEAVEGVQSEESEINGILFALILGVIAGTFVFIDAYAGRPESLSRGQDASEDSHH